jgi:hypothetical protein
MVIIFFLSIQVFRENRTKDGLPIARKDLKMDGYEEGK